MTSIDLSDNAVNEHRQHLSARLGLEFTGDQVRDAVQWGQELTKAFDEVGLALVPKAILSDDQVKEALQIRIKPIGDAV